MLLGSDIQNVLHPAGIQASRIGSLWNGYMVVLVTVYVVVVIWMLAAVWRAHRSTAPQVSDAEERPHSITVGVASALTLVTLIGLLIASVATGSAVGTYGDKRSDALEIDVTGHQWWWEVQYPDPEPDKSFKTANEIHVPLNTPVLLRLATRDVIHSLWIPNLNGKRDLIPGRVNKLWIQADRPGVFRSQCAEFCGLQHAHMALVVVAESNEKFQRWKTHQQTAANDPVTPQQLHGRSVFLSLPCVNCHAITGTDAYATIGPDLTHVASRPTLAAGELLNSKGNLGGWIVNAPAIKPGTAMPPNQVAANDLNDLLAYLENLK
ncbi:MAG TPA: cytochrome c oxidase subunit II [Thermoanaerobaculia bacterium]